MTYYILTIGCQMNKADSERLAAYLENYGCQTTTNEMQADILAITTCGVRQGAEDRVYGLINRWRKKNPRAVIILTGCLSERPDVFRRLEGVVDIWLPIVKLPTLWKQIKKLRPVIKKTNAELEIENYLTLNAKYSSKFSAFVPIGNGCNNFCAYCVVPYARGRETYRPANEIIAEVKKLLKAGYREISLIAQNVNSYRSGKVDFPQLLRKINALPGRFWLKFASSHPKDMSAELIKALHDCPKVCEHIHLAVQSGDDKILQIMNRKYTVAHYKKLVKGIRQAFQKRIGVAPAITTDVIVGFPGETKRQFLNTIKLFKEVKFALAYISQYSPRYGTVAAKMVDDVPRLEKKAREFQLNNVLSQTAFWNNKPYVNKVVEVLVEGKNKLGQWFGKTRTYKLVKIDPLKNSNNLVGQFVKVKITKAQDFGLHGKIYEK